ncbi:gamma tubulin complex GCP2 subunit Alp4 [Schizosaccharomyces osmophilus]|uniref:Spindle pole body component n=1 Tax=Schizosaccharomyces osmophilus TaxID=2545709 RepID=A0AAF0AWR0_9SCHI|nr:gamma tubulin complex GCP2 subunit Alp4 [Schizosaccharomyces osmophilus]WBW73982.1 gamma tubulin complex GCP2 subunit Alp4 [Schizosaccharomyces osmophilus]
MVRSNTSVHSNEDTGLESPSKSFPHEQNVYQVQLIQDAESPLITRSQSNYLHYGKITRNPSELSLRDQEKCLIDELLNAFMGMEGNYIHLQDASSLSHSQKIVSPPSFTICPGFDLGLKDIISETLELGSYYLSIVTFIESRSQFDYGYINHALCAALRRFISDYLVLLMQCEHRCQVDPGFSLQTLRLYILPTFRSMKLVYFIIRDLVLSTEHDQQEDDMGLDNIDDLLEKLNQGNDISQIMQSSISRKKVCKGGRVLTYLTDALTNFAGDPIARNILTFLLRESSRPYMRFLNSWIHEGKIDDPYEEFMIKSHRSLTSQRLDDDYTDEYWEKRYVIREDQVPAQLSQLKDKVLLAGKYLNVVIECKQASGDNVSQTLAANPEEENPGWPDTLEDENFTKNIIDAYVYANESLLLLLQSSQSLYSHLHALKHYFFLDQSDFFSTFLDTAQQELRKPVKLISATKLQSQLDLSLRQPGTITAVDPFKEYLTLELNQTSLIDWLMHIVSISGLEDSALVQSEKGMMDHFTNRMDSGSDQKSQSSSSKGTTEKEIDGFEAMQFGYKVPFPLSLILSRKAIIRYQLLFRFFLMVKRVEMQLENSWLHHSKKPTWKNKSPFPRIERWKKKAWFMRTRMLTLIQKIRYYSMNEVIETHWPVFMKSIEHARTVDNLMQEHVDFLDTCLKECMLTNSKLLKVNAKLLGTCGMFASYTSSFTRSLQLAETGEESYDDVRMDKMEEILKRYEENFAHHLRVLMDACNFYASTETAALLNLVMRLST